MFVSGNRNNGTSWRIGVRDPLGGDSLLCKLLISGCAVVTSGNYERFFDYNGKRYHHIINPKTGYPSVGCSSVTIITSRAEFADAVATAVFVLGPERGLDLIERLEGVEGLIVSSGDERRLPSSGFGQFLHGGSLDE